MQRFGVPRAMHENRNEKYGKHLRESYLALDVDSAEGGCPEWLEELELVRFCCQEHDVTVAFLKGNFANVVDNELRRMPISLEAQLFGDEAESHVWFVTA